VSALPATSRARTVPDDVPKKKDGRGRPRKDRTLELAKSAAATAVSGAVVGNIAIMSLSVAALCWSVVE